MLPLIILASAFLTNADAKEKSLREIYSQPPESWPAPHIDPSVHFLEIAPLPAPIETNPNLSKLGASLFFDPRLSKSRQISCASCHDPELAWADGRSLPAGNHRKILKRNTPSILNAVRQPHFFWDGRSTSLENLVESVVQNQDEMHGDFQEICPQIQSLPQYQNLFSKAFGDTSVTTQGITSAIAEFIRSIQSKGQSRFDQFISGKHEILSDQEILGLHLFRTKASCVNCHHGPFFTDHKFHDLGLSYFGRDLEDLGRYQITRNPADSGAFKTPSLRNITRTAPYMHVGLFHLRGVLNLYNAGMPNIKTPPGKENHPLLPKKSPLLKPLRLSEQEIHAIEAFLKTLEEPPQRIPKQPFPPIQD